MAGIISVNEVESIRNERHPSSPLHCGVEAIWDTPPGGVCVCFQPEEVFIWDSDSYVFADDEIRWMAALNRWVMMRGAVVLKVGPSSVDSALGVYSDSSGANQASLKACE